METLEIILNVLMALVLVITLLMLYGIGKYCRQTSNPVSQEQKLNFISQHLKFSSYLMVALKLCMAAILLVATLIFHPEPCLMRSIGIALAVLWAIYAIGYEILSKKFS